MACFHSHRLPSDVVQEYFRQEHFSLKRLLAKLSQQMSECNGLNIIHTRTDQFVHRMPSLPADRGMSADNKEAIDTVVNLVHDQPHLLVIEHLSRLRSEALVRGAIQAWAQHPTRNVFLLLVDMAHKLALDRTNFVRMVVEQHIPEGSDKTFALVLHYPPSSFGQCYPALFLGGWDHVFLDSVGNDSSFNVDQFVALACQDSFASFDRLDMRVHQSIQSLLPRIMPYLASQTLFYSDQDTNKQKSFYQQKNALVRIMNTVLGDSTIAEILCSRFSAIWLDHALLSTTKLASEALLQGTTQLSLSMSIHSVLVQSFQAFLGAALADANQWMNLDLVSASSDAEVSKLFGIALKSLPVLPLEELILQQRNSSFSRLHPLPPLRSLKAVPLFPFFSFLSEYFDELIECILEAHSHTGAHKRLSVEECFLLAERHLGGASGESKHFKNDNIERQHLVRVMIDFVTEDAAKLHQHESLFDRYLTQFVEWKLGQDAFPLLLNWLRKQLDDVGASKSVLAVHVVARLEQLDVMKVASTAAVVASLNEEYVTSSLNLSDMFTVIFNTLEGTVEGGRSRNSPKWSVLLSSLTRRENWSLSGLSLMDDRAIVYKLRRLAFFLLWEKLAMPPPDNESHWLHSPNDSSTSAEFLSLSCFIETARLETLSEIRAALTLFQYFLSPTWLHMTDIFKEEDILYLLQFVSERKCSGLNYQAVVGLLRIAASCRGAKVYGFSVDVMLYLNGSLSADNLANFSEESTRTCMPHFIPDWLFAHDETDTVNTNNTYFYKYQHCFDSIESCMVFDLLMPIFTAEAENSTSETLFLHLQRGIDDEMSLTKQSHLDLSRIRKFAQEKSLRGSPLAAIALSARLVCFVAKIAFEVATEMKVDVFEGVYGRDAFAFMGELMLLKKATWQSFCIGSILKHRGEGTLSTALRTGGPLHELPWCRAWVDGLPSAQTGVVEALQAAEVTLAEAEAEEQKKSHAFRLCPHPDCQQPFIVAAANCGQFTCGRDAHMINGHPALNNTVINGTHGCGRAFNLVEAPPYRLDERILEPFRTQILVEQSRLDRCRSSEMLWKQAVLTIVPPVVHVVQTVSTRGSFLPISELLPAKITELEESEHMQLVRVLWESSNLVSRLHVLPDLVEVGSDLLGIYIFST